MRVEGGAHAWQEKRPLQRAVRIILECILVQLGGQSADILISDAIYVPACECETSQRHFPLSQRISFTYIDKVFINN